MDTRRELFQNQGLGVLAILIVTSTMIVHPVTSLRVFLSTAFTMVDIMRMSGCKGDSVLTVWLVLAVGLPGALRGSGRDRGRDACTFPSDGLKGSAGSYQGEGNMCIEATWSSHSLVFRGQRIRRVIHLAKFPVGYLALKSCIRYWSGTRNGVVSISLLARAPTELNKMPTQLSKAERTS